MSTRTGKWILIIGLLLFALYAAYPPMRVAVLREQIVEKVAQDSDEAERHGVSVGESYVAETETITRRFLPFALGQRDEEIRVVERKEDGTVVKERTEFVEGRINRGLDIAGGTELVYELRPPEHDVDAEIDAGRVIDILHRRIDPQNIKEYIIQPAGEDRILIQVPEATQAEVAALKDRVTRMGRLEFRIGLPPDQYSEDYERAEEEGVVTPGYEKMYIDGDPDNRFFLIRTGEPEITGERLESVHVDRDEMGAPAVGFRFSPEGGRQFATITRRNQGYLLGAVLDGVLQSAPTIRTTIRERGQITGDFTQEEVDNLVAVLQAGSLPMDLDILQETTVGPQLGQDSIERGLRAIIVAGAVVVLIMGGYYLVCGMVADAALMFNLVLLAGVLGLLGAALTLPGLAGILLTVGMAVDANVLIFERIREETKAGKSIHVALRNGYDKVYSTIMDANITTLLTALILYMVGTGPVRGFAITLSVGIVLSLFTSLYVTRLVLETLVAREWIKSFKMAAFIGQPSFSYSKFRRIGYVSSLVVLVLGLGVLTLRGRDMLDVDFTGGTLVHLSFAEPVESDNIRRTLVDAGYPNPQVQGVRAADERGATEFRVRIPGVGEERVREQVKPGIAEKLEAEGLVFLQDDEGKIEVGRDGRSINLELTREIDEMALRRVLAADPDNPYELEHVDTVLPEGAPQLDRFSVRITDTGFRTKDEVVLDVLWVLNEARAEQIDVHMDVPDELQGGEEENGAEQEYFLTVTTDSPLDWRVFKTGLRELGIEDIVIETEEEDVRTDTFTVKGPEDELLKFVSGEVSFPDVDIDNATVAADLESPVRRLRLVLLAEQAHIEDNIVIVGEGYETDRYVLELGDESVRENIEAIFAGLGVTGGVEVTAQTQSSDEPGKVLASLEFAEPQGDDTILYRLQEAGIEPGEYLLTELPPGAATHEIELLLPEERAEAMGSALSDSFSDASPVSQTSSIGSVVAAEMQGRALLAIVFASIIIVIYVGVRFHALKFGVAAVIALLHDVAITVGIIALADLSGLFGDVKINLPMLAAFLTIIGYSLNDTIVVFDRIRENMIQQGKKRLGGGVIDLSINQTLSRTLLTSFTTLVVVTILYVFGGVALQGLAFTLIVGVIVGTYSSVFVASPLLLDWELLVGGARTFLKVLFFPLRAPFMLAGKVKG